MLGGDGEAWSGPYSASLLRQDTAECRACGDLFSAALRVEVSQGTLAAATHKAYVELGLDAAGLPAASALGGAPELVARIYLRDPDHLDLIRAVLPRDLP